MWRSKRNRTNVIQTMFSNPEIIFFDCETTGLSPDKDYIIELAALKYSIEDGTELRKKDTLHLYLKPPFAISEKITELTGITNAFLADKKDESALFQEIYQFFGNTPVLGGHNEPFDQGFLSELYYRHGKILNPVGTVDTLEMARDLLELKSYKLGLVYEALGLSSVTHFHCALDDITATEEIFEILYNTYFEELGKKEERKIRPIVFSARYWAGYRGNSRIYVSTNMGSVFYNIRSKYWDTKDAPMDSMDMEFVEQEAWRIAGAKTQQEFDHYRG